MINGSIVSLKYIYGRQELATVNLIDLLQSLVFTSIDLSTSITRFLSISINMHIYYVKILKNKIMMLGAFMYLILRLLHFCLREKIRVCL